MNERTYQFSIEDFHNKAEEARKFIITQYAANLMIVAASTIKDGNEAETIVGDAYVELLKHAEEFHSQSAIKEFLYNKVKEDCEKFLTTSLPVRRHGNGGC